MKLLINRDYVGVPATHGHSLCEGLLLSIEQFEFETGTKQTVLVLKLTVLILTVSF